MMDIVERIQKFENLIDKMARLRRKMNVLECREEDIKEELNYAESLSMKKRKRSVQNWLNSVGEMRNKVQELEQRVQQGGIRSNIQLPYTIDRLAMEVTELSQQVFHEGLTFEAHDNQGLELQTTELVGRKFHDRKKMIHENLRSDDILSIGIYGMGGVGKTTLIMHIHNELLNQPNTSVFWITVSQNFSIYKLQNDIAKALSVDLRNEGEEKIRAAIIARALRMRNNVVLILDDLWNAFLPESVGIEMQGRCKVIFTTRSLEVCDQMACHSKIEVVPLTDEEAWMLFMRTLGTSTTLITHKIEETAECLTKECAGLPLGIITVAGSMRGVDDIREWRDALEAMRSQSADNLQLEKVFHILRYSYDALRDQTLQECFLYCSLFPEDYEIPQLDLIALFVDEGLIRGMRSREAELNRGHTILNKLEKACLLQCVVAQWNQKHLKMHDLVRDMALRIANENGRFWVEAGLLRSVNIVDEEKWSMGLERVSFIDSNLLDTPSNASPPMCPRLSTLLLRSCKNICRLPNTFFIHMVKLTVLDLCHTEIVELPMSVSSLKCLTALLLRHCRNLKSVVPLSDLRALKRLDLSFTGIKELPQGIEMLVNLRELNLWDVDSLEMIPVGILNRLSHLQYLALPRLKIMAKAMAEEIASLQKLERFQGKFTSINDLDAYLRSWKDGNRPNEYLLVVDDRTWQDIDDVEVQKKVYISDCHKLGMLCELKSLKFASDLRECSVLTSDPFWHVLCQGCYYLPFVQSLEALNLRSLPDLCDLVWEGTCASSLPELPRIPSTGGTFSSLKHFRICGCPKIKKLFTLALLSHLGNLETLKVYYCEKLVEIVQVLPEDDDDRGREAMFKQKGKEKDHEATGAVMFNTLPKLTVLEMKYLPELESFCTSRKMVSNSIQEIFIVYCPKLKRLPLIREELHPPISLTRIDVDKEWWDSSEFDQPNTKEILQPFVHY